MIIRVSVRSNKEKLVVLRISQAPEEKMSYPFVSQHHTYFHNPLKEARVPAGLVVVVVS
jgi:hypothetical protein